MTALTPQPQLASLGPRGYGRFVVPSRRRSGSLIGIIVGCVLAVSSNGCSFTWAEGPPAHPRSGQPLDCTDSYTLPVLDTVFAVVGGTVCLFAYSLGAALGGSPKPAFYGLLAVTVVAPAGSAIYGYNKVGDCRDVRQTSASSVPEYAPRPAD